LYCGLCKKHKLKTCPKKAQIKMLTKMTPACSQAMLDVSKISGYLMDEALRFSTMRKSQIMMLMSLLDAELRLRPKGLSLGTSAFFKFKWEGKELRSKVHLVSFPREGDTALGVAFINKGVGKRPSTSITISKEDFVTSNNTLLLRIWDAMEIKVSREDSFNVKKRIVLKIIQRLGKRRLKILFKLKGIKINTTTKLGDIASELSKYF